MVRGLSSGIQRICSDKDWLKHLVVALGPQLKQEALEGEWFDEEGGEAEAAAGKLLLMVVIPKAELGFL